MSESGVRDFSRVVCSSPGVRSAFSEHRALRTWWRLVLTLHGKPHEPGMSEAERANCVADGFRFYAGLYRSLAVLFWALALLLLTLLGVLDSHNLGFWSLASALAGMYLWLVSSLGYAGAKSYRSRNAQSVPALIAFMVMIVAFLSLFLAAVSVVAHQTGWLATGPNLAGAVSLFVFGVGSYLIEIIYLATEGNLFRHPGEKVG